MEYCIFNDLKLSIPVYLESILLRSSLLFAKKVHLATFTSDYIGMYYAPEEFTDEQKLKSYPGVLARLDKLNDEQELRKDIEEYIYYKKIKHKTPGDLIIYHHAKNVMNKIDLLMKAEIDDKLAAYNFDQIKGFYSKKGENVLVVWKGVNENNNLSELPYRVETISRAFIFSNLIPVLTLLNKLKNVFQKNINEADNTYFEKISEPVIEMKLFEFPSVQPIKYDQTKQIREAVSEKISQFHNELEKFNEFNYNRTFNKDLLKNIKEFKLCNTGILNEVQEILDKNIYLEQAGRNYPEYGRCTASLNFTSFETLINIYHEMKIICHDTLLYLKEEVAKHYPLGNLTSFLTINNQFPSKVRKK